MLAYLIWGAGYGFAAAVQPGPFQAYLVALAARSGWRRALPAALAPLVSDGPIIVLVLLALSRLPPWWLQVLRFAGGAYVLYLAQGAWRAWRDFPSVRPDSASSRRSGVLRAALVNLLNPAPYLYWGLVTGPLLIEGWRQSPARALALLAGFYGVMLSVLAALILLCAGAGKLGGGTNRVLLLLSVLALVVFGLWQIASGIFS